MSLGRPVNPESAILATPANMHGRLTRGTRHWHPRFDPLAVCDRAARLESPRATVARLNKPLPVAVLVPVWLGGAVGVAEEGCEAAGECVALELGERTAGLSKALEGVLEFA